MLWQEKPNSHFSSVLQEARKIRILFLKEELWSYYTVLLQAFFCSITASGSEQFDALCKKGDALMDSCMLAETRDDFPSAISFCNCALGGLTAHYLCI